MKKYIIILLILLSTTTKAEIKQINSKDNNFIQNILATYENDSIYGGDKYYTNGVQLLLTTKTFNIVSNSILYNIFDKSYYNYSFGLAQKMFTPENINTTELIANDRPYAGYLYLFLNTNIYHNNQLDSIGLSIGCTGKCSLAENIQTKIHDMIGSPVPEGWDNQLSNQLLFMISYLKMININKTLDYTYDWQLTPKFHINLGTPYTNSSIHLEFRYGYNLEKDYIQNRLNSNQLGIIRNSYNKNMNDISYYIFLEAIANINLYDTFLDNTYNNGRYEHNIKKEIFNYEINGGLSFRYSNYYIKYSTIFISKQFKEQNDNELIFGITAGYLF